MLLPLFLCVLLPLAHARTHQDNSFHEQQFRRKVDAALVTARQILKAEREPVYYASAENVPHAYEDKYMLAEFLAKSASRSLLNLLRQLNATDAVIADALEWAVADTVLLQFSAEQRCALDRWALREVESPKKVVKTKVDGKAESTTTTTTDQTVLVKNESFWNLDLEYELSIVRRGDGRRVPLVSGRRRDVITTVVPSQPYPAVSQRGPLDLDLSWLLGSTDSVRNVAGATADGSSFAIDRSSELTRTPRRNKQVEQAINFYSLLNDWAASVKLLFLNDVVKKSSDKDIRGSDLTAENVFVPVLPIMEEVGSKSCAPDNVDFNHTCDSTPSESTLSSFLVEEDKSLRRRLDKVGVEYDGRAGLFAGEEARLVVLLTHAQTIAEYLSAGLDFVENMLRQQLMAAVGKELSAHSLGEYMDYHNRQFLAEQYAPLPFSYAVRRSNESSPEGLLSIEFNGGSGTSGSDGDRQQIKTTVRRLDDEMMGIPIDAATTVRFGGLRYIHSWLQHSFAGELGRGGNKFSIVASARQFSSFILVLGRVTAADTIEPTYAVIVKDKDFLRIPLDMDIVPSAKEFRDATQSLSFQQQEFAKAFRSMQLSNTLFAVTTIQIKPQLEKVLNLAPDSLTKEIKLTQDLMELFIKYQIPTDLLSFSVDTGGATNSERVSAVTASVKAMKDMIALSKEELQKESEIESDFEHPKRRRGHGGVRMASERFSHDDSILESGNTFMAMGAAAAEPAMAFADEAPSSQRALRGEAGTAHASYGDGQADEIPIDGPSDHNGFGQAPSIGNSAFDITAMPTLLDSNFDEYCNGSVLRAAILNSNLPWTLTRQQTILSASERTLIGTEEAAREKLKAFELIDALTKSGGLTIDHASTHIIIATQHSFDNTLTNTVVQDNINPIEKLEVSALTAAATLHGLPIQSLLRVDPLARLTSTYPQLSALNKQEY